MKMIGVTGGVGAGKSEILAYIEKKYNARILLADEIAHMLMEPGTECYQKLRQVFGNSDLYQNDGRFDRKKLAEEIFRKPDMREKLNRIVHPAVKKEIIRIQKEEQEKKQISYLILEAALLIEERYDKICDELWYVYTAKEKRRSRLKENRGYSDEKIDGIFASQLPEQTYREFCRITIDNNGQRDKTFAQIDEAFLKG